MILIHLIQNLSILVAISVLSGFIDSKYEGKTLTGKILQGILFGGVAIFAMLYPFTLTKGVIIDGRSVVISLCTLFFGPVAGFISSFLAVSFRIYLGGGGTLTGVLIITVSFLSGYLFYYLKINRKIRLTKIVLYLFGVLVSTFMMTLMLSLPSSYVRETYNSITLTVMIFYPLITLLIGKVLLDQEEKKNYLEQISQEKKIYSTTLHSIGDAVISTDKEGNVVTINSVGEKITGWTKQEALGKPLEHIFKIINEFTRAKVENPVTRVLKEGTVVGLANHTILISKDGIEIPIADSGAPVKDESGTINGVVLVFRDQKEEREAARKIEESELRLRRAELASKSGNWEFHLNTRKIIASEGAALIYGVHGSIFDYQTIRDIPLPEYRQKLDSVLKNLIEKKEPYDIEFKIKTLSTGEIKDIHSTAFYDEDQNILYGIIQDITERKIVEEKRKKAEEALIKSEALYRNLFQNMLNGFAYCKMLYQDGDPVDFIYLSVNSAFESLTGLKNVVNKKISEVIPGILESDPELIARYGRVALTGIPEMFEAYVKALKMWFSISVYSPEKGYFVAIFDAITERKKNEQALIDSEFRYRQLFYLSPVPMMVHQEGRFTKVNEACVRVFGAKDASELIGTPIINRVHPDYRQAVTDRVKKVTNENATAPLIEEKLLKLDGTVIDAEVIALQVQFQGKVAVQIVLQDISERKRKDEYLKLLEYSVDAAPDGAYWLDDTGRFLYVNDSACKALGYTAEELLQMSVFDVSLTATPERWLEIWKSLKTKKFFTIETVHRRKDGSKFPVEINSAYIKFGDKEYCNGFVRDISERKRAEEALKESEEKYRRIFLNHSAVKFLIDPESGNIIQANNAASKFYGWTKNELEKMNISQINILSPDRIKNELDKAKTMQRIYFEFKHRKADGSIRDVEVYTSKVTIGGKDYLHSIIHDITEKKKAERELQKHSMAIEQSPVSIVITDINGNIEYVNPNFTTVSHYTYDEVFGKNANILKSGKQSQDYYKNMWDTLLSGKTWSGVFSNKRKNGELFWESAIISPIKNEFDEVTNFVAVKEDITEKVQKDIELGKYREHLENLVVERTEELDSLNKDLLSQLQKQRELEEQLQAALSKEKEINELKTRFIATVSHEFRTPLASLFSSAQMIQRYSHKWSKEKLAEHYSRISSTVNYLTQLVDDVLTISRTDREVLVNNPERVAVEELFKSFKEEIKSTLSNRHELIYNIKDEGKTILIDKKLLRQIVINLLTNAVKYSPEGGRLELLIDIENKKLKIKISDQGCGIPEDEIQYVFEPFYRAKNSVGIQGTGLGLNIVKRCIEILGGEILLNSQINKGTTFNIIIPIYE